MRFIGVSFEQRFPVFSGAGDRQGDENYGPFYSPNQVLSWWPNDSKHRTWLEGVAKYWAARGYTPTICEHA